MTSIPAFHPTCRPAASAFLTLALALGMAAPPVAARQVTGDGPGHFHPKGRPPSEHTRALQRERRQRLPFEDRRDFEERNRGFLAEPDERVIRGDDGAVVWDMEQFDFLLAERDHDSIHPSLQRQALLNMNYGLYRVTDRIVQVRGFDLANITFVEGDTGWIVFDALTSRETAAAALAFVNRTLGERPVRAVVISHSHVDHFGGVRGLLGEEDLASGRAELIVPEGFVEEAISENVYAGNAMTRRASYQYGIYLPASPFGPVDSAIGKKVSRGTIGLLQPTRTITEPVEELTVDGVRMVFHNTPGTEAPAEMNTWFPDWKVLWMAENVTATIHNIYTLRGALVRDPLVWSKKINEALRRFGVDAEVMIASHNWPRWGNDRIQEVLRAQRDAYAHLNNRVLHLANRGVTIAEIHDAFEVPASLRDTWAARGYHGSFEHNARGVMQRYLGYWDGNPATLVPLPPAQTAPLYVDMMGGAERILTRGRELFSEGSYRLAMEILDRLVQAEPDHQAAKDLLADCFEQLGYQAESPSVRNSYLAAAAELRSGIPPGLPTRSTPRDVVASMPTELFLDFLGIRMDSEAVEEAGLSFRINIVHPDTDERFILELSNATLTTLPGFSAGDADGTLTVDRSQFVRLMTQEATLPQLMAEGHLTMEGDLSGWARLAATFVEFDPFFEIMPGTRSR